MQARGAVFTPLPRALSQSKDLRSKWEARSQRHHQENMTTALISRQLSTHPIDFFSTKILSIARQALVCTCLENPKIVSIVARRLYALASKIQKSSPSLARRLYALASKIQISLFNSNFNCFRKLSQLSCVEQFLKRLKKGLQFQVY